MELPVNIWKEIPLATKPNLVESMPRRVAAVIVAKGVSCPVTFFLIVYYSVIAALNSEVLTYVSDIVLSPPEQDKYNILKARLISEFSDSEQKRIKALLSELTLGDDKPSHLLRKMRNLAGRKLSYDFLKTLWLQRLPQSAQAIISISEGNLDKLSVMVDKILEISPNNPNEIHADRNHNFNFELMVNRSCLSAPGGFQMQIVCVWSYTTPLICAAVGCSNAKAGCKEKKVSYHKFPLGNKSLLKEWLARMKREGFNPTQYSQQCSEHFEEECLTYQPFSNRRFFKPDAASTKFEHNQHEPKRKRNTYQFQPAYEPDDTVEDATFKAVSVQTDESVFTCLLDSLNLAGEKIEELENLLASKTFCYQVLSKDNILFNSVTGFTPTVFDTVFNFLMLTELKDSCTVSAKDKFFIFLVRIKSSDN
ncbi:uncharacterized protein [Parasteatoda tepidariorum]|uniref:uncharacterized protein n=1 Tax=Parasteatoda tepidariorum TaxID=114398 RepID=UPI0039BC8B78